MKKFKRNSMLCLLLVMTLAVTMVMTACGGNGGEDASSGTDSHYPVTVTTYNYEGEAIETTYEKAPEKVIAVYQGSIETMIALGLEDRVAACYGLDNEVKDEWKEAFGKMNYQEQPFAPDKEMVTMAGADMILSWGSLFAEENLGDVDTWIEQGVNTYINTNTRAEGDRTLENEYTDILNIGKIFNVEDKAEALVEEMKAEVSAVVDKVEGQEKVKVAMVEPINDNITNYGKASLGGNMIEALGGELALTEFAQIGKEDLLAADPEVIFVVYMAYAGDDPEKVKKEQLAAIKDDPALASLQAVKNDNIHLIMLGDMYASGPRTIDGLKVLSEGMYPELSK